MKFKKYPAFFLLFVVATGFLFNRFQSQKSGAETQPQITEASSLAEGKYCLALRGNGELEPAHWGAAARVIEQWGMPSAMAGGSSGSITMFMLNAVAQNPFVTELGLDTAERNRRASLIVKSFMGFFTELKRTQFTKDFFKLYGEFNKIKAEQMTKQMLTFFVLKRYSEVIGILNQGLQQGIFSLFSTEHLIESLKSGDEKAARFHLDQLKESIALFGQFDALKDANLFFRPGLVNFEKAAGSIGRWASFYALPMKSEIVLKSWSNFIQECSAGSENKTWPQIIKDKPQCDGLFQVVFKSYFDHEPKEKFEERQIGSPIAVYPSTSVLVGSAARQVEKGFLDYKKSLNPTFGLDFKIQNTEEVLFGYWGNPQLLKKIKSNLDPKDEKSRRFYGLGQASWKTVLSLSPAEPGLASLLPFEAEGQKIFSAGGWSDLHPINVLKASGCEKVVFLTRQGGESLFAQGVANRLMNLNRDPIKFNAELNAAGDLTESPSSTWSKLFNMANPKSSVNTALAAASAVACTNWNAFDVKTNLEELVEESYRSAYWIGSTAGPDVDLKPVLQEQKPGCQPRL